MEEFAKLIFENWQREADYNVGYFSDKGRELLDEAEKFLNVQLVDKFYFLLAENGEEIMRTAFVAGFGYACKCLTNGRIELTGGVVCE